MVRSKRLGVVQVAVPEESGETGQMVYSVDAGPGSPILVFGLDVPGQVHQLCHGGCLASKFRVV